MTTMIKLKVLGMVVLLLLSSASVILADPPPPPDPGGNPTGGGGGTPVGAPIDGGLGILLAMGAIYGGRKLYIARKDKKEKESTEEDIAEE
ncbi:MAG: hypothetical protein WCO02_10325 [Bacteroidota bacterium]